LRTNIDMLLWFEIMRENCNIFSIYIKGKCAYKFNTELWNTKYAVCGSFNVYVPYIAFCYSQ